MSFQTHLFWVGGGCPTKKNKIEEEVMITLPSVPNDEILEYGLTPAGRYVFGVCSGDAALDTEKERSESTKKPTAGSA